MSDIMRPMSIGHLMKLGIKRIQKRKEVFLVLISLYITQADRHFLFMRKRFESPFGPAAGPNTQLAQNIIASYVAVPDSLN